VGISAKKETKAVASSWRDLKGALYAQEDLWEQEQEERERERLMLEREQEIEERERKSRREALSAKPKEKVVLGQNDLRIEKSLSASSNSNSNKKRDDSTGNAKPPLSSSASYSTSTTASSSTTSNSRKPKENPFTLAAHVKTTSQYPIVRGASSFLSSRPVLFPHESTRKEHQIKESGHCDWTSMSFVYFVFLLASFVESFFLLLTL
jgi:hypothetical protein